MGMFCVTFNFAPPQGFQDLAYVVLARVHSKNEAMFTILQQYDPACSFLQGRRYFGIIFIDAISLYLSRSSQSLSEVNIDNRKSYT